MTMPLVWLLPTLRASSGRWVELGGVVKDLSDFPLFPSFWHSMILGAFSFVLVFVEVSHKVWELCRSQCSTLADLLTCCWSLWVAVAAGEGAETPAREEGERTSCLWKRSVHLKWCLYITHFINTDGFRFPFHFHPINETDGKLGRVFDVLSCSETQ